MADPAVQRLSVDEFFAWCAKDDDTHWELIDGHPVAMAPPVREHRAIASELGFHIRAALSGRPGCTVEMPGGVMNSATNSYFEPDIVVSCQPIERGQRETPDPVLIVEVLSPTTEDTDRKVKLPAYRQLSKVNEIVLIDPSRLYAEIHRRLDGGAWLTDLLVHADARLRLDSVGLDVGLADVYANVPFDDAADAALSRPTDAASISEDA